MSDDKDIKDFKREVRRCALLRGFTFKREYKRKRKAPIVKAALMSLADSPSRSAHEHAAMAWMRYIQIPITGDNNTSSIDDVSYNSLIAVLSVMKIARPDFNQEI